MMESINIKKKRKKKKSIFYTHITKKKKKTMEQFQQSQGCRKMHLTKHSTDAY